MAAVPRRLKRIEVYCPEYQTTATIRINDAHSSGTDRLEVDYRSPDHSHFTIEIPDDWTDQDLLELIFLPPRDPGRQNWPAWEIPAYDLVSSSLFRFWKGEKKARQVNWGFSLVCYTVQRAVRAMLIASGSSMDPAKGALASGNSLACTGQGSPTLPRGVSQPAFISCICERADKLVAF